MPRRRGKQLPDGTVYLLHFDTRFKHAGHYLGWTPRAVEDRLQDHMSGRGARLIEVIINAGHTFELARTWKGTTELEKAIKRRGGAARICPICNPTGAMSQAQFKRGMKNAREWVRNRGELKQDVAGLGFASEEADVIYVSPTPVGADGEQVTLLTFARDGLLGPTPVPNLN